jgi:hypothetical protein
LPVPLGVSTTLVFPLPPASVRFTALPAVTLLTPVSAALENVPLPEPEVADAVAALAAAAAALAVAEVALAATAAVRSVVIAVTAEVLRSVTVELMVA